MSLSRRAFLASMAGAAVLGGTPALAQARMARLIAESHAIPDVSGRIDFISRALLGSRYRADTLIGGADKPEVFVTRDDVFDCVTYCEAVWAAAKARSADDYEPLLKKIRYHNGVVSWRERNHDFAAWCERNVANGIFARVDIPGSVTVNKTMAVPAALGRRHYVFTAVPRAALLQHRALLKTGDIMGFVSARPQLDFYHCAFVIVEGGGRIALRHAALSAGRVTNQKLESFIAANGSRHVTVLRPL